MFEEFIGKTVSAVEGCEVSSADIRFVCTDGSNYVMYHPQDCCKEVSLEDVNGNISDLIGTPITAAEGCSFGENGKNAEDMSLPYYHDESFTWTFYTFGTAKGRVVLRWYGSSNSYYSESVYFKR